MTVLYIDNEYCYDIEQLKRCFDSITINSSSCTDLLEYGRNGDIAAWLREHNDSDIADQIDTIDINLGDSEYINQLANIITGAKYVVTKKSFEDCVKYMVSIDDRLDENIIVSISLIVIQSVKESYIISVKSNWGEMTVNFTPGNYEKGDNESLNFAFEEIDGIDLGDVQVSIDNNIIYHKNPRKVNLELGECSIAMIHIPGDKTSNMSDFYISETPVTIEQYKALMPDSEKDLVDYLESCYTCKYNSFSIVSAYTVQNVMHFLDNITAISFALPSREQWLHLVKNHYKRVKWCDPNDCVDYDYHRIDWELTGTNRFDLYCLLGIEYEENGTKSIKGHCIPSSQEKGNLGYRLICSESNIKRFKHV